MAISLTHATVAVGTEAGNGEVGKDEWNASHTLTMAANFILGRTTAGTGAVEELSASTVRSFLNVEDGADVTDATNVTAAGALMDSELTSEASVKAINQGLATTDSPTFAGFTSTDDVDLSKSSTAFFNIDIPSGSGGRVQFLTSSSLRWQFGKNAGVESGSNAGSDFTIARYTDAGAFTGNAMFIERSTGYINLPDVYNETTASAANMFIASDGSLQRSTSSLRYKIDVEDMTYGLKEVLSLRPVTYAPKPNGDNDSELETRYGGLIAEEVDAAGLKEFVGYNDEGQPDSLHYGHMVALCVKAIQELKAEVDELRSKSNG